MASDTRERMIEAAAELIRTRGLHDASFTAVLESSGAARGAIYHHFPGGKEELAREAVLLTQRQFLERLRQGPGDSPEAVLETFLEMLSELVRSRGGPGCAAGAVVQDAGSGGPALADVAAGTFRAWVDEIAAEFARAGMAKGAAESFATLMIAALEGVHLLCRAAGGPQPFDAVGRSLRLALHALLATPQPRTAGSSRAPGRARGRRSHRGSGGGLE